MGNAERWTRRRLSAVPAFYAAGTGGWRDWWTLLHPPYTAWHLVLRGDRRLTGAARRPQPAPVHAPGVPPRRRVGRACAGRTARASARNPHSDADADRGHGAWLGRSDRARCRRSGPRRVAVASVHGARPAPRRGLQLGAVRGPGPHRRRVRARLGIVPRAGGLCRPDRPAGAQPGDSPPGAPSPCRRHSVA